MNGWLFKNWLPRDRRELLTRCWAFAWGMYQGWRLRGMIEASRRGRA